MDIRRFHLVPIALTVGILAVAVTIGARWLPATSFAPTFGNGLVNRTTVSSAPMAADAYAPQIGAGQSPGFAMPVPPPAPQTGGLTAAETAQKLIRTGSLDLSVANVDEAEGKLAAIATGAGGYVQTSSVNARDDGSKFGSMTVRVPSDQFDQTVAAAKKLATLVKSETTNGQDVTEQYTDLQAQLVSAQAQEQEYLAILKQAKTVQDILNVQQYLGNIRSTIETLQGRIKYLSNQTSYATLAVSFSEDTKIQAPSQGFRPLEDMRAAAQALVLLAESLLTWLIWAVIVGGGILIPLALIAWGITALVRRFLRQRR